MIQDENCYRCEKRRFSLNKCDLIVSNNSACRRKLLTSQQRVYLVVNVNVFLGVFSGVLPHAINTFSHRYNWKYAIMLLFSHFSYCITFNTSRQQIS